MKKFITSLLIVMIIAISFSVISQAMSFDFIPDPTEKVVYPGDTVEIKLNVKNIKDIEEGINTIVGFMDYEEEYFSSMEFEGNDKWGVTYNDRTKSDLYGKFAITTMRNGVKQDEKVATLTLKLKDNLQEGETEIHFTKLVSSDGENSIEEDNRTVRLIVRQKPAGQTDDNTKEEQKDTPQGTTKQETKKNQTSTGAKTGDKILFFVGVIVVAILVWAIAFVVTKKKDKEDKTENQDK